jgi:hypothetical protein
MRAFFLAVALLSLGSSALAEPLDPRADAVNRILPGQRVRVHSADRAIEGTFVTNRSDSLLLRQAAERVSLSYSDIHRIDLQRSARAHGLVIGIIVGAVTLGVAAASGHDVGPVFAAASGAFLGGFLGGAIGGGIHEWHRVYEAPPAPADSLPFSPRH